MAINSETRALLELVYRSKETVNGWKQIGAPLFSHVQNRAIDAGDLVEFAVNKDRVGFIRLTKKGKKSIKKR